jgi:hypothetical protein
VVAGNTLIDFSATPEAMRGGLSLALTFAARTATAAAKPGDDEDDWFASYTSNLMRLGFHVSPSAFTRSSFKKRNIAVHKAIIPFLTIALGGAAVGPIILAALNNLSTMDESAPWITLFDRESRKYEVREMHFAAVGSDVVESRVRHVTARLSFVDERTNVLFFKLNDVSAEFESATTTMTVNNSLLAVLEPKLHARLADSASDFIAAAPV